MTDWNTFSDTQNQSLKTYGKTPSIREYFILKMIENGYSIAILLLTIIFTIIAFVSKSEDLNKINWALHAAELCLGVFLGLNLSKGSHNTQ